MKKVTLIISLFLAMLISTNAMATWSFDISDTNDDGTFEVLFLSDEGSIGMNSFSLGFGYDTSELSLKSYVFNPLLYNFTPLSSGNTSQIGMILDVSGSAFIPNTYSLEKNTLIASFTFDILSPLDNQDGLSDFYFMNWNTNIGNGSFGVNPIGSDTIFFDDLSNGGHLTYGLNTDKGSAVPIPSAILLLGGGLMGMLGIRRKMKK